MKRFDGVIFDWAGTTVDYGSFAPVQAFVEAFSEFGILPTMEEVRAPMGMLKIDHIRTMLSMERIQNLWKDKYGSMWTEADVRKVYELSEKKIFDLLPNFAEPKSYVLETITKIKEAGLKIGSTTGYTKEMMEIVVPKAAKNGYEPDCWICPDDAGGIGRPYPYMIYANMEKLHLMDIRRVIKVGDTAADIKEGKNAGMISIGIIEGSSVMGLTEQEYSALQEEEKKAADKRVKEAYLEAGADYTVQDIRGLLEFLEI